MTLRAILLGAPALVSMSVFTSALAGGPMTSPLKVTSVEFTPTPAPTSDLERALPYTRSEAVVTLADGSKKTFLRRHHITACPRRPSSPILQNLIFGTHNSNRRSRSLSSPSVIVSSGEPASGFDREALNQHLIASLTSC